MGIEGDADEPGGLTFTDELGRSLEAAGRAIPPGGRPPPRGHWIPPPNEPLDCSSVWFDEPARTG